MSAYRYGPKVTLGPCPGCENWQLDYGDHAASQYFVTTVDEDGTETVDTQPWHDAVEFVLHGHLQECPELQQLLFGS